MNVVCIHQLFKKVLANSTFKHVSIQHESTRQDIIIIDNVLLTFASQCLEQMTPADIMANPSLTALDQCVCYATHWVLCYEYDKFRSRDVKMTKVNKGCIVHIFDDSQPPQSNYQLVLSLEPTKVFIKLENKLSNTLNVRALMVPF